MSSLLSRNKDQSNTRKSLSDSSTVSPSAATTRSPRHERVSRLSSSGSSGSSEPSKERTPSTEAYFARRENRLAARKKAEEEAAGNDYKKMYEEALTTNEKLKSRLELSKQEQVLVQSQLEKVNLQRKGKLTDSSSNMLETEKKERQVLEKKIADMEEEVKTKTDLKMENQRLKDENGALIRVISKLSK